MDIQNENNHVFNIRLANLIGVYQMLDPKTIQFRGRNVFQIFFAFFVLYLAVMSLVLFVECLYLCTYNTAMSLLDFYVVTNSFFACYKMWIVIYRSNDIWDCLSITRYGFTSLTNRKGHEILDLWRARSVWYTSLLAGSYFWASFIYAGSCLAFGNVVMPIKNHDGSIGNYRLNIINLHFFASDETYNEYYNTFFVGEVLFLFVTAMFYSVFDIILMTLCLAICGQMQMISAAFESVNYKSLSDSHSSIDNNDEKQIMSNEHDLIYDELKTIIIDHQAVIKKFELFLHIFDRIMLSHIFVSSVSLIILWVTLIMSFFNDSTFAIAGDTNIKMIVSIPTFLFQIFMTCYLFENLNDQKDSIIYALYSSNWTEMDMKCKKLILLTMQLNNANQKKLKFTRTRIVNMEMFFKTMGHCYTVVSVLINYINAKND